MARAVGHGHGIAPAASRHAVRNPLEFQRAPEDSAARNHEIHRQNRDAARHRHRLSCHSARQGPHDRRKARCRRPSSACPRGHEERDRRSHQARPQGPSFATPGRRQSAGDERRRLSKGHGRSRRSLGRPRRRRCDALRRRLPGPRSGRLPQGQACIRRRRHRLLPVRRVQVQEAQATQAAARRRRRHQPGRRPTCRSPCAGTARGHEARQGSRQPATQRLRSDLRGRGRASARRRQGAVSR